jgi:hypothetical protein
MGNEVELILQEFRRDPAAMSGSVLRQTLREELPHHMLEVYGESKQWKIRNWAVRFAIGYSRRSEDSVMLGKIALFDRSKHVRFEACALLACSLRSDAIPNLCEAREKFPDSMTQEGTIAAIDAINSQNHAFFLDRDHSGKFVVNFEVPVLPDCA